MAEIRVHPNTLLKSSSLIETPNSVYQASATVEAAPLLSRMSRTWRTHSVQITFFQKTKKSSTRKKKKRRRMLDYNINIFHQLTN
jgi:hypothetical protein